MRAMLQLQQGRLVQSFHYALRPGGFLLLGTSERLAGNARLFTELDKKQRLYARRDDVHTGRAISPARGATPSTTSARRRRPRRGRPTTGSSSRPAKRWNRGRRPTW